MSRLTFDPAGDVNPVWTPDGRRIVFGSTRHGQRPNLYWQRVDGTGEIQRLTEADRVHEPGSWDLSGRILAFTERDAETGASSLMLLRLEGDEASGWRPAQPTSLMKSAQEPMFSPDGRWLAYVAKDPGREKLEVYVQPFPGPGGRWQISTDGGVNPAWSRTRRELLYATPDHRLMTVSYAVNGNSFHAENPHLLPNSRFLPRVVARSFDLHPDGNRVALVKAPEAPVAKRDHVIVIFNFFDELRRIAPAGK